MQIYVLEKVLHFLAEIGLSARFEEHATGFLPHVAIRHGALFVAPECPVSNLLHEAGHVAITPKRWRYLMHGDLAWGQALMWDELQKLALHPDDPLSRAVIQAGEQEAIAWSWAAGEYLGIPADSVIGEEVPDSVALRLALQFRAHPGIHGLQHAGFCATRPGHPTLPPYPQLARWTCEL